MQRSDGQCGRQQWNDIKADRYNIYKTLHETIIDLDSMYYGGRIAGVHDE